MEAGFRKVRRDPQNKNYNIIQIDTYIGGYHGDRQLLDQREIRLPRMDAPMSEWFRFFGGEEEVKLNAIRNHLVTVRASIRQSMKSRANGNTGRSITSALLDMPRGRKPRVKKVVKKTVKRKAKPKKK